jgi:hypothetical protein
LPIGSDDVNWVPVDILSRIMTEIIEGACQIEGQWTKYYHLANPHTAKWDEFVPIIQEHFSTPRKGSSGENKSIQTVSIAEWLQKLEESSQSKDLDVARNPAVKLLDFYQDFGKEGVISILSTKEAQKGSKTMRELGPVKAEWMKLWLEQWSF